MSIYQKNLQVLGTEIFKARLHVSPEILKELFYFNLRNYNLRGQSTLKRMKINSVYLSSKSLSSLAPKIWDFVPDSSKNENSIKWLTCTTDKCPCRICKVYISQVGIISAVPMLFTDWLYWLFVLIINLCIILLLITLFFIPIEMKLIKIIIITIIIQKKSC